MLCGFETTNNFSANSSFPTTIIVTFMCYFLIEVQNLRPTIYKNTVNKEPLSLFSYRRLLSIVFFHEGLKYVSLVFP